MEYIEHMIELAKQGKTQGVFFFAAAYAAVMCLYSWAFQFKCNKWQSTEGDLVSTDISQSGFGDSTAEKHYRAKALYNFTVNGQSYEGKKISAWVFTTNSKALVQKYIDMIPKLANGQITVYYNPKNPKKSMLITPGIKSQLTTIFIGALLPFFYILKYHM